VLSARIDEDVFCRIDIVAMTLDDAQSSTAPKLFVYFCGFGFVWPYKNF
jgi:hypothetical protein